MLKYFVVNFFVILIILPVKGNEVISIDGYNSMFHIYLRADMTSNDYLYIFASGHGFDRNNPEKYHGGQFYWEHRLANILKGTLENINKGLVILNTNVVLFDPVIVKKNSVVVIDSDIDGITWRTGAPGINPTDQIAVNLYPLKTFEEYKKEMQETSKENHTQRIVKMLNHRFDRRPNSVYTPSAVLALTGMYNPEISQGYCVGLSNSEEFDGEKIFPSAILWISEFSSPKFQVSHILSNNKDIYLKDRFTHIAASFFNTVPLIVYRNNRDGSIHVIDYDPKLLLGNSPGRPVVLPKEFQDRDVESLLLTAGKEMACLGVVFTSKNEKESKNFLLFSRTKNTTDWKEFATFEMPSDSLSPTMCIQGNDLFYAYLQPVIIENPPETTDKLGKTSTDKKVVIFKHSLNSNSSKSQEP